MSTFHNSNKSDVKRRNTLGCLDQYMAASSCNHIYIYIYNGDDIIVHEVVEYIHEIENAYTYLSRFYESEHCPMDGFVSR